jgi:metal-responsive CopG/Arc/MetJ family transcriptional regulator
MKEKKVMTSFMIDPNVLAALTEEARRQGRRRSQVLRRIVDQYLEDSEFSARTDEARAAVEAI